MVAALTDERLADVLEELPEEDQVEIMGQLESERAADVLEEMDPDDAADLIAELPPETAEMLLQLMEPDEAEDVKRLMSYVENTAGAMMTSEPVILGPDATIADALAHVRNPDLTPALAALVYVCRPPLETPDGPLPRRRPHPATAARATVDPGRGRPRRLDGEPALRGDASTRSPPTWRPTTWWRRRWSTRTATCSGRSPSTTCSTTCSRRTGATGRCAVADSSTRRARLDTPRETRRQLVRRPAYDSDRFGVFAEQFARFLGHGVVPDLHDAVRRLLDRLERRGPDDSPMQFDPYPFIFLTLILSLQASYAAPLILLAQNRQEARDRVIAEQDRQADSRAHADMEFLAREVASLRMAVGEVATRDFLRSELRCLLGELDERARGRPADDARSGRPPVRSAAPDQPSATGQLTNEPTRKYSVSRCTRSCSVRRGQLGPAEQPLGRHHDRGRREVARRGRARG